MSTLKPSEIQFVTDEPAFLLNNWSTAMPSKRTVDNTRDKLDILDI